ncbi:TldD/PmbA family protein [Candidatus Micrarchaeota archaeon]|nr:TldD/PmbA family protein [Candidatus Micrarchaeota archaeon]
MKPELEETAAFLLRQLLEKGADDAVVHAHSSSLHQIKFANNKVAKTGIDDAASAIVFVAKNGRTAMTTLKRFDREQATETAAKLVKFTSSLQPNPSYAGIAEGSFKYPSVPDFDSNLTSLEDKAVDLVEKCVNAAREQGAERTAGVFEWGTEEEFLVTSRSVEARQEGTSLYFSLRAMAADGSGHKVAVARKLSSLKAREAAEQAGELAVKSRNPVDAKAGNYEVVFDPLSFSCLLDTAGQAASIFSVEAGFSFFAGKQGTQVASPAFTMWDDGTLEQGFNSTAFDDEGVPTRKNLLIDKGVLKGFLHNTSTAKRHETQTTANAGLVAPEPWNLVVEPGRHSLEELFAEAKNGLYITNVWYTRFQNYVSGDFSTIPRDAAFLIKDGELTQPVKGLRVSENMVSLLKKVKALGRDRQQIRGWEVETPVLTPPALIEKVRITRPVS